MNMELAGGLLLAANVIYFLMAVGRGDKWFACFHFVMAAFVAVAWLT